jgi:ABC-type antimicrobial peptide transport system permease subunit
LQALDADLPVWLGPFTLAERMADVYWDRELYGGLFLTLAVLALLLASVGLYAVVAHSVSQRTQEMGIRMAIGGTAHDIRRLVFGQSLVPMGGGLLLGLTASLAVNRVLASTLVGVAPSDPTTLVAASVVLAASGAIGCWIPARRATRLDPVAALKRE